MRWLNRSFSAFSSTKESTLLRCRSGMRELIKVEKLLVAAGRLASEGRSQFSAEDLVVAGFRAYPNDFSLKGYPEYPDSNPILTQLMGKDARLIVKGWIEKTGTKTYRLTPKGMHDLASLSDE